MKEIYIIRHGETELNRLGMVQGRGVNTSLNETGEAQARAFYEYYKTVPFDKIYTSSLQRTQQTVKDFIADGIPVEHLANLDEMSWGEWEGKPSTAESKLAFSQLNEQWAAGNFDAKFEGGESPKQVALRLKAALIHVLSNTPEKCVLICMHGRVLRMIMCLLLNKSLTEMDSFLHSNTTLYHLQIDKANKITLLKVNNTQHLN
jgi:probable phosphoglycerate mutase